jgi:hypothetical protein
MDSGKFKLSNINFSAVNLAKECLTLISMQAKMKKLNIDVRISDDFPE